MRCYRVTFENGKQRDVYFKTNMDAVEWSMQLPVRKLEDHNGLVIYETDGDLTIGRLAIMVGLMLALYVAGYYLLTFFD